MNIDQLAPEEPLSPELVLVLPPELRAQAVARLPPPIWPTRSSIGAAPALADDSLADDSSMRLLGIVLFARVAQLIVIFVAVTALTLVLAAVANAVRSGI